MEQKRLIRHDLFVSYRGKEKTLINQMYESLGQLLMDAFGLFEDEQFTVDNAIVTYLDEKNIETLLIDLPTSGQHTRLSIKSIHPVCALCLNSFGIIDDQLLYECPRRICGEQYCRGCVQAIQKLSPNITFKCLSCQEKVIPERNPLIEEHIIWKKFQKLYGVEDFCHLMSDVKFLSCKPILDDIQSRYAHIASRYNTFTQKLDKKQPKDSSYQHIIDAAEELLTKLKNCTNGLIPINEKMNARDITVDDCSRLYETTLKKFHTVYKNLLKITHRLQTENNSMMVNTFDNGVEHVEITNDSINLSSDQSIPAIDSILEDIRFRQQLLTSSLELIILSSLSHAENISLLQGDINQANQLLTTMKKIEDDLMFLRLSLKAIKICLDDYDNCLRDGQYERIPCSKFIFVLETLRVQTERLAMKANFPNVDGLITQWRNIDYTPNNFKPKVIELFRAIKNDLTQGLIDQNGIYSISYRVGVIGDGSVGKTSLVRILGNISPEYLSTISFHRSTFGYLEFECSMQICPHTNQTLPITFVDIEGATDACDTESIGNYREIIVKADCDLYLIVFDRSFNDQHQNWKYFIEKDLHRKCLLVWNKADEHFLKLFREQSRSEYKINTKDSLIVKDVLNRIRRHASTAYNREQLTDEVYLAAADCEEKLNQATFATFDLDKLRKKILKTATVDSRVERMRRLATLSSTIVINTCFRRGYIISTTPYNIAAAAVSAIPGLEEVPKYFGRKEIDRAFGIDGKLADSDSMKESTLEEYLLTYNFTLSKEHLISDRFNYLVPKKQEMSTTSNAFVGTEMAEPMKYTKTKLVNSTKSNNNTKTSITARVTQGVAIGGAVAGRFANDIARIFIPAASISSKALSIACATAGFALIPVFAALSYYSTKKHLNNHLDALCNDLLIVFASFITAVCNECLQKAGSPEICTDCFSETK